MWNLFDFAENLWKMTKNQQKSVKKFAAFEFIRTFAFPYKREQYWRDGRVVECGGLENR